jgi:CheY-like chemotaxis protein
VQAALPGQALQPPTPGRPLPQQGVAAQSQQPSAGRPLPAEAAPGQDTPPGGTPAQQPGAQPWPAADDTSGAGTAHSAPSNGTAPRPPQQHTAAPGTPSPSAGAPRAAQPLPAEAAPPVDPNSTQGRAISVRTLGQGVPFNRQAAQVQQPSAVPVSPSAPQQTATPPPHQPGGSGRRRKLGTPPDPATRTDQAARPEQGQPRPAEQAPRMEQGARPHPTAQHTPPPVAAQVPAPAGAPVPSQPSLAGQSRLAQMTEGGGRSYAIGAPDENAAEGPEPLDGPGGAVEVADPPRPQPMDDELPPEPLDNPRRLLVWPAPDVSTQQALSDRGYRPVIVNSREEVDAQIAAFPAALFVDPLTGPITRTALQSLRQAAVAAEVPVLVTAGLGQASRDAAYGADPAVLLKALAPRDSEQHPPRVLLIEEHAEIALALTATLERRGMQVARAASDADAVTLAGQFRPNLVVMDLLQVHRRQEGFAGIVDWLRANGQLNRTPLVVYTAAVDQADLPRLASGETVLFLAERSTSSEVQSRIVELLSRIGTN